MDDKLGANFIIFDKKMIFSKKIANLIIISLIFAQTYSVPVRADWGTSNTNMGFESGNTLGWTIGAGNTGNMTTTITQSGTGVSLITGSPGNVTFNSDPRGAVGSPSSPYYQPAVTAATWSFTAYQNNMLALQPNLDDSANRWAAVSADLGLSTTQRDALSTLLQQQADASGYGSGNIENIAYVYRTVTLTAGTTYTMAWNYIGTDYVPFNDGSITTLVPITAGTTTVNNYIQNYALLGFTNPGTGDYSAGTFGSTGWQTSTYSVDQNGDYKLGFAIFNLDDTSLSPALLIDSLAGLTTRNGQAFDPVQPNPGTSAPNNASAPTITEITGSGTFNSSNASNNSYYPIFNGGTLTVDESTSQVFTVRNTGGVIMISSGSGELSGNISDQSGESNGSLNKTGAGTLILSGNNSFTGTMTVSAGTLAITSANALGSNSSGTIISSGAILDLRNVAIGNEVLTINGGTLRASTGTSSLSGNIALGGNSTVDVGGSQLTLSGIISGANYALTKTGSGALTLSGANTYSGGTTVTGGGILALINSGSISNSSVVTVTSGTFNISGATGNVNLAGTYTQASDGNLSMGFSPTNNQRLIVTGATSLAGGLVLNASAGTYRPGRYSLITSGTRSGTFGSFNGTSLDQYTRLDYSLAYDATNIYLILNPDLADTQQSLVNTASVLQGTFTLQNSVMVNGFTYDCPVFDKHGVCISVGGRNTTVQAQGINNTNALLIASYRLNKNNSRIGAWVDQNLSMSGPGTVQLNNSTPMVGLFGVWSQRPDDVGAEVKLSAAYGQKDTTITRQVVNTSEAGSGSSQLISQGAQLVGKYGFAVMPDVLVSPYAGVRYTQNNMGGYTEASAAAVFASLTYSALNTNATTALAGAEVKYKGIIKTILFASAGVETDTNTSSGSYSATGLNGLTSINFNPNPVKTRPTATVGGYYDITKSQRFGVTGIYRQEPFQAVSTTTVLATYTIGL
jgi:autotransporter-associated beta strand protein